MKQLTIVEALREAMREEMTRDVNVILLGEDGSSKWLVLDNAFDRISEK